MGICRRALKRRVLEALHLSVLATTDPTQTCPWDTCEYSYILMGSVEQSMRSSQPSSAHARRCVVEKLSQDFTQRNIKEIVQSRVRESGSGKQDVCKRL